LVPGLLQTETYAREVLRTMQSHDRLERVLALRMGRQDILQREDPPFLVILIKEAVLREPVGGPETPTAGRSHPVTGRSGGMLDERDSRVRIGDLHHQARVAFVRQFEDDGLRWVVDVPEDSLAVNVEGAGGQNAGHVGARGADALRLLAGGGAEPLRQGGAGFPIRRPGGCGLASPCFNDVPWEPGTPWLNSDISCHARSIRHTS
jgi:hypothetical protein